jgi:hypothetical protein
MRRENGNQSRYRLVEEMLRGCSISRDNFEEHLRFLEKMKSGVLRGQ